jgi:hypothetical protein
MKLRSFNIEHMIAAGNQAEAIFKDTLGYNNACFDSISITDYSVNMAFELNDDFQEGLPPAEKCKAGWHVPISLMEDIPLDEFWNAISTWPTREQRELHVMAAQLAKVGQSCDGMVGKQVEAFVNQIKSAQSDLALLVHKP